MTRPNVTSLRRCPYCGAKTKRLDACEACRDLLTVDPYADETGLPLELALEPADAEALAIEAEQRQDPRL